MRRQFALVRRMPPCSDRPSSLRRPFRKSHAVRPRSLSQHFGFVWSQQRKMCRIATGTPILPAIAPCLSSAISYRLSASHAELLGAPLQPELVGWRHVADKRGCRDDDRACQEPFAADAHAVLPVAVERGDRALPLFQRVRPLTEAGPAPRLA